MMKGNVGRSHTCGIRGGHNEGLQEGFLDGRAKCYLLCQDRGIKVSSKCHEPVDFTTWERSMKEESDLDSVHGGVVGLNFLDSFGLLYTPFELGVVLFVGMLTTNEISQHGRHQHQMIVLYPNHIIVLEEISDDSGEFEVCLLVCQPIGFIEVHFTWVVVKQRPEDRV